MNKATIIEATRLVRDVVYSTVCPDPGEGGCMGGPIQGYGCLNEAASSACRYLEKGEVEDAIELLELIQRKVDGRVEVAAALNLLCGLEKEGT